MGDLTINFSRKEFACQCGCGFDTIDFKLIEALQACVTALSYKYKKACIAIVSGGNRCVRHNTALRELYKATGGTKGANTALTSQHIYGRAADFKIYLKEEKKGGKFQIEPEEIAVWFEENRSEFSIGRYNNRTHVDSRTNGPARWDTRS